jgi:hypothetical protein
MKFFRYRRPSLKTLLGVTRAKKRLKKDLGITALLRPLRWWPNQKRRIKREIGYESEPGRLLRDGLPKPTGCLLAAVLWGTVFSGTLLLGLMAGGQAVFANLDANHCGTKAAPVASIEAPTQVGHVDDTHIAAPTGR